MTETTNCLRLADPVAPQQSVIDVLEELLAEAKTGEIRSICVVTHRTGQQIGTIFSGENYTMLMGGMVVAQKRIAELFTT